MTEQQYEWLQQVAGVKVLCDFGSCQHGSMLKCKKCNATICLDHQTLHLKSCGLSDSVKYEYENDLMGVRWENAES